MAERVTFPITNDLLSLPAMSWGSYWASGYGISVYDHPPLVGNTLGTTWFLCFLMLPGSFGPFGIFLVWVEVERFR
jgi:hypothetical protein